ncbi:Ca2+-binding RTX toxin-like protein [Desulfobaculum xiamenense]|uniref:Ca2+-binding RTX toxin-like protein n=1 Tax=Desulfobaculum xiamenense TaxID=995050 RepID=A0A846QG33_9BACT|nr:Ig-like domain-containing protein [Desulfobaculum xiamenense]NJB67268.1 Ca2+-binding RTX toxin-like protein [Desulfobaculum xiamenense]
MEQVGKVVALVGQAFAESETGSRPLENGSPVYQGETLATASGSSLEVRFSDDSVLAQGENSHLTLDEYVYSPSDPSSSNLLVRMSEGTYRMVTGHIAEDNPDGVALRSPLATIGIRGTGVDMQIGPDGERFGIFDYHQFDLVVTTPQGTRFITDGHMILDVGADGGLGMPRPYTPLEQQQFQQLAPISTIPPRDGGGGEGSDDQSEGPGEGGDGEEGPADGGELAGTEGDELGEAEGDSREDELADGAEEGDAFGGEQGTGNGETLIGQGGEGDPLAPAGSGELGQGLMLDGPPVIMPPSGPLGILPVTLDPWGMLLSPSPTWILVNLTPEDVVLFPPPQFDAEMDEGDDEDDAPVQPPRPQGINYIGTPDADLKYASNYDDTLRGEGGADTLQGFGGNDIIDGGTGNDSLTGGNGNDVVAGAAGDDVIDGGAGCDVLLGGIGDDTIRLAEVGDAAPGEVIDGGEGSDVLLLQGAGGELDLTVDGGPQVTGVERIDIQSQGAVELVLNAEMVATATDGVLTIVGNEVQGHHVTLWGEWYSADTVQYEGQIFNRFVCEGDGQPATVLVAQGIETHVNSAPIALESFVELPEDSAAGYVFTLADFEFEDADEDELQSIRVNADAFQVGGLYLDGVLLTGEVEISRADIEAGRLGYGVDVQAHPNFCGEESFTFQVWDGQGYGDAASMNVAITPVNDAPTAADASYTINEDTTLSFVPSKFTGAWEDVDGDDLAGIRITSLPGAGSLTFNGVACAVGQEIAADQLGHLKFTPAENVSGAAYATFGYQVYDGTAYSAESYTFTVNVNAVNDAPIAGDGTLSVTKNSIYEFDADDFHFSDPADPGDQLGSVTIHFAECDLGQDGVLFYDNTVVEGDITISVNDLGKLRYDAGANEAGAEYGYITYSVADGGGAESETATLIINVVAGPNSAPELDVNPTGSGGDYDRATSLNSDVGHAAVAAHDATVSDPDGDALTGMTISMDDAAEGDWLTVDLSDTDLVAEYSGGDGQPLVLTITGEASAETYQRVLRSIGYESHDDQLTETGRIVRVVVTDSNNATSQEQQVYIALPSAMLGAPGDNDDSLEGTNEDEDIRALGGNDTVDAGGGRDTVSGGSGDDFLNGNAGRDVLSYRNSEDAVKVVLLAHDTLAGPAGDDSVFGFEEVWGSRFDDTLIGNDGSNRFMPGHGNNVVNGLGGEHNEVSYADAERGVSMNLEEGRAQHWSQGVEGAESYVDTLSGISDIVGSRFSDTIVGDEGDNCIVGGEGYDYLDGGGGDDTVSYIDAHEGVVVTFVDGTPPAMGTDEVVNFEHVVGSAYADTITGSAFSNSITGGGGADELVGGGGADWFIYASPADGGDTISDFSANDDFFRFDSSAFGLNYSNELLDANFLSQADRPTSPVFDDGGGVGFVWVSGEKALYFYSSEYSNGVLIATLPNIGTGVDLSAANIMLDDGTMPAVQDMRVLVDDPDNMHGMDDADYMLGRGGDDTLKGEEGDDYLDGGAGSDILHGDEGDDSLDGGAGSDFLCGGRIVDNGGETLLSDDGTDVVMYTDASQGVNVDLQAGTATTGDDTDTLLGIDGAVGSRFDDTFTAGEDAVTYVFEGGLGNDVYDGTAAEDVMVTYRHSEVGVQVDLSSNDGLATRDLDGNGTVDETDTLWGVSNIEGSEFDDTLIGGENPDGEWFDGRGGADLIDGKSGYDAVSYASSVGAVFVNLDAGLDGEYGLAYAAEGTDTLKNIEGVYGTDYNDTFRGDDRDNTFRGGIGDDYIDGGEGQDRVDFKHATGGVLVDLADGVAEGADGNDTLVSIEDVRGSNHDDTVYGTVGANRIEARGGNDKVQGDDGNDLIDGGAGDDSLYGDAGDDTIIGGEGGDSIDGGEGWDWLDYSAETDTISVNLVDGRVVTASGTDTVAGVEMFVGTVGNDSFLAGSSGDDVCFMGGQGNDTYTGNNGDGGSCEVAYIESSGGVFVNLSEQNVTIGGITQDSHTGSDGEGGTDVFSGMSGVIGSFNDDTLVLSENLNGYAMGLGGHDFIRGHGRGGDMDKSYEVSFEGLPDYEVHNGVKVNLTSEVRDGLEAHTAQDGWYDTDTLEGITDVIGTELGDTIYGSDVQTDLGTWFRGNKGDDSLVGHEGLQNDTADYGDADGGVQVYLYDFDGLHGGEGYSTGADGNDYLVSIEHADGSNFDDVLVGNDANNRLMGRDGNDLLVGGAGADTLDGGEGADTFFYGDIADGGDMLEYFSSGEDVLEFLASAFGLPEGALNVAKFVNVDGTYDPGLSGDVDGPCFVLDDTTLYYDADGTNTAGGATAICSNSGGLELTADDIHIVTAMG